MDKHAVRLFPVARRGMNFLFFATVLLFCRDTAAQTTPPESRENQAAETVFKNIQALKGMRAGDLQGAMSFIQFAERGLRLLPPTRFQQGREEAEATRARDDTHGSPDQRRIIPRGKYR
jgi:hypothetical protein